jgi:hypothetical protein
MPLRGPQQAIDPGDADIELRRDSIARHAITGETANLGALGARGRRPTLVVGGGLGGGNPVAGTLTLLAEMFSEV